MKKILLRITGGMGKAIMGTAIAKQLRFKYPDATIHVQTSYPDPFYNLGCIDRYFPMEPVPYFYDEHKDFEIIDTEPYLHSGFRAGESHLIDAWCERLGLDLPKDRKGELVLDREEENYAENLLVGMKLDRPLLALQICGGTSYYDPQKAQDPFKTKHYRDYPVEKAQELANKIVQSGIAAIIQIGLPTEPRLENVMHLPDNQIVGPRQLFAILKQATYGVFIDSFCQHAWNALGKEKAVVLWGGTDPSTLGYSSNVNMTMKKACDNLHCNRPNTFLHDFIGNKSYWKCPFNAKCMDFNPESVLSRLQAVVNEQQEKAEKASKKVEAPKALKSVK